MPGDEAPRAVVVSARAWSRGLALPWQSGPFGGARPPAMPADGQEAPGGVEADALAALDQGDRETALTLLMDAYGASLYRYCRQMVDADLVDDVHQMTFVQAFEGMGRFARGSSLRTWLFGIARHRCLDALKASRRRGARFQAAATLPERPDPTVRADGRMAARAMVRALQRCLAQLPPSGRAAVLLRFQAGLSYPEMSEAAGERPATLQARVARALPVLRRCLERQGIAR